MHSLPEIVECQLLQVSFVCLTDISVSFALLWKSSSKSEIDCEYPVKFEFESGIKTDVVGGGWLVSREK